jgi:hypothetical protein
MLRTLAAIVLHEMIHQAMHEIHGKPHAGHAAAFIAECNRVAGALAEQGFAVSRLEPRDYAGANTWPMPPVHPGPPVVSQGVR